MDADDDDDNNNNKRIKNNKKSILERLEPVKSGKNSVTKERRIGRGFGRGGGRGGYNKNSNNSTSNDKKTLLSSSLAQQFPARKDERGDVVVKCYGCQIIRINSKGETYLFRDSITSDKYEQALQVFNIHLAKIGFSIKGNDAVKKDNDGDTMMMSNETPLSKTSSSGNWTVSGHKKFMRFVDDGMLLPPPLTPGPGRQLALLMPNTTKS